MAFGKKKPDELAGAPGLDAPEPEDALSAELFAAPGGADGAADTSQAQAAGDETTEAGAPPEAPSADAPAGADALLQMFQESRIESNDNAVILDLAGDVEMDDLLEELLTVATALGIRLESRAA